jgi:hypothetical protein
MFNFNLASISQQIDNGCIYLHFADGNSLPLSSFTRTVGGDYELIECDTACNCGQLHKVPRDR